MARREVIDGNEAAAWVAYRASEVIAIYPITPASTMSELADTWAARGIPNAWGTVPRIVEMQSEAGAAGVIHGALQTGALATTFTASQGLLLMLPEMYKIAGELTPTVIHVAARTVATHALSIFGDHSDVMAARPTGWRSCARRPCRKPRTSLSSHMRATLQTRVPFLHFFDGFRTSHELNTIERLEPLDLTFMLDEQLVHEHRARALHPSAPVIRGTSQNPDVFFQSREAANQIIPPRRAGNRAGDVRRTRAANGRRYRLFDYYGDPEAERVIIAMGSATHSVERAIDALRARGERVGVVSARLFRPFAADAFVAALPATTVAVAVLDRTKEPGSQGEPLYQDVVTALAERDAPLPVLTGGRYGLASKEFTPAMAAAVFEELGRATPRRRFTVGINDDVTRLSLDVHPSVVREGDGIKRAVFFGLGADGTVSANRSSISIIGEEAGLHAQGYFVYDSKKSGSTTVSHLRFGSEPIAAPYLIEQADFVACHQPGLLESLDVLAIAAPGATVLLNTPEPPTRVWESLPARARAQISDRGLRLHVVDAAKIARDAGLGRRVNTVLQPVSSRSPT